MLASSESHAHKERLLKLLGMTASDSDGEALAAIRKCNDMLTRHKLRWDDIVQLPRPSRERESMRPRHTPHADDEAVKDYSRSSRFFFEESIRRQNYFKRTGRNAKAAYLCAYIRTMSLPLRLLFFPLWAAAAMVAAIVIPATSRTVRVMAACFVAFATLAYTLVWLELVSGVLGFLFAV